MKKKSIRLLIISLLLFSSITLPAQNESESVKPKKEVKEIKEPYLFMGGALWLGFGTYTFVDINYIFGTQITERWNVALSAKYQYYNDKRSIVGNFETSVYGGSVYSQFAVIKNFRDILPVKTNSGIIAHAEYEFLNTDYNYLFFETEDTRDRYWLQNVLLGGGYIQRMDKKASTYIILLWNLTKSIDNPYTYPQIRFGFTITL